MLRFAGSGTARWEVVCFLDVQRFEFAEKSNLIHHSRRESELKNIYRFRYKSRLVCRLHFEECIANEQNLNRLCLESGRSMKSLGKKKKTLHATDTQLRRKKRGNESANILE